MQLRITDISIIEEYGNCTTEIPFNAIDNIRTEKKKPSMALPIIGGIMIVAGGSLCLLTGELNPVGAVIGLFGFGLLITGLVRQDKYTLIISSKLASISIQECLEKQKELLANIREKMGGGRK